MAPPQGDFHQHVSGQRPLGVRLHEVKQTNSLRSAENAERYSCEKENCSSRSVGNNTDTPLVAFAPQKTAPSHRNPKIFVFHTPKGKKEVLKSPPPRGASSMATSVSASCTSASGNHHQMQNSPLPESEKKQMLRQLSSLSCKLRRAEEQVKMVPDLKSSLTEMQSAISALNNEHAIARGEYAAVVESLRDEIRKIHRTQTYGGNEATLPGSILKKNDPMCKDQDEEGTACSDITDDVSASKMNIDQDQLKQFTEITADLTERLGGYQTKVDSLEKERKDLLCRLKKMGAERESLTVEKKDVAEQLARMKDDKKLIRTKVERLESTIMKLQKELQISKTEEEKISASCPEHEIGGPEISAKISDLRDMKTRLQTSKAVVSIFNKQCRRVDETINSFVSGMGPKSPPQFEVLMKMNKQLKEKVDILSALLIKGDQLMDRVDGKNKNVSSLSKRATHGIKLEYEHPSDEMVSSLAKELDSWMNAFESRCSDIESRKLELDSAMLKGLVDGAKSNCSCSLQSINFEECLNSAESAKLTENFLKMKGHSAEKKGTRDGPLFHDPFRDEHSSSEIDLMQDINTESSSRLPLCEALARLKTLKTDGNSTSAMDVVQNNELRHSSRSSLFEAVERLRTLGGSKSVLAEVLDEMNKSEEGKGKGGYAFQLDQRLANLTWVENFVNAVQDIDAATPDVEMDV